MNRQLHFRGDVRGSIKDVVYMPRALKGGGAEVVRWDVLGVDYDFQADRSTVWVQGKVEEGVR